MRGRLPNLPIHRLIARICRFSVGVRYWVEIARMDPIVGFAPTGKKRQQVNPFLSRKGGKPVVDIFKGMVSELIKEREDHHSEFYIAGPADCCHIAQELLHVGPPLVLFAGHPSVAECNIWLGNLPDAVPFIRKKTTRDWA